MQLLILIVLTLCIGIIFYDIYKNDLNVRRVAFLAAIAFITCYFTYMGQGVGHWAIWLTCGIIWTALAVARDQLRRAKIEAAKLKEVRERWKMPEGDFHPWIPTRPKEDDE
jgi:hypothetical protein